MRRKRLAPFGMWIVFEIVAVTLWLTKDNLFYLLNFSYIGTSITVGLLLFQFNYKHARRIVQLLVGLYMLIYLGLICRENMQMEGFWYYLFTGVFEAATIHYAVAKIFGPLLFGRGWCGYACWTEMCIRDSSFTVKAVADEQEYYLLNQFCTMIHNLDLRICIEGVENEQEWAMIRKLYPEFTQGYFWGKPCELSLIHI